MSISTHNNSQVFDYYPPGSPPSTPTRQFSSAYLTDSNYTSQYIYNRLLSATVAQASGNPLTLGTPIQLVSNTYDVTQGTCAQALSQSSAATMHDDTNYPIGFNYRGNLIQTIGPNGTDATCYSYDTAGVVVQTTGPTGVSTTIQTNADSKYSLPGVITPNGNGDMATSISYSTSFAATQVVGPNGVTASTSYDTYGRPTSSTIPDGATTNYSYVYYSDTGNSGHVNTQAAVVNGRWRVTTMDGFGRPIQVDSGHDATPGNNPVTRVLTEYAACACSPLGKLHRVSLPFAPGGTPVWTTYYYDALGRATSVVAPDGASTGQTAYAGNSTTVTDPAAKWKKSTTDVFGNLTVVTEPNPAGGADLTTSYSYSPFNQLLTVQMTRGSITQNRSFTYVGQDLTSATNPENGTVSYSYNNAHQVVTRIDAKGQHTVYSYDSYGRVSQIQHYLAGGQEDPQQGVHYSYDSGTYGMGHLTEVTFGGEQRDDMNDTYSYDYTYGPAGRIATQKMTVIANVSNYSNYPWISFSGAYTWDNEGRLTSMQSPSVTTPDTIGYSIPTGTFGYSYDADGRMTSMTKDSYAYASASYGPAGEMLTLAYGMGTEQRTYNSMLQLVHQVISGKLDMTYNYSARANNGRITSSVDAITSENTAYTYDSLNRLTGAANSAWTETYTYDGFGNLTSKAGTGGAPSMSTLTFDQYNHQVGASYDANGNLQVGSYSVENRMVSSGGSSYGYDPSGKRVMVQQASQGTGSNNYQYHYYGIDGRRLVTVGCTAVVNQKLPSCAVLGQNIYYGSKLLVSNGVYVATDRLGSVRANSQGESFAYYPYGEERTSTVDGRDKFGTYFRDGVGQDYADQRYYNSGIGRFGAADPGGLATAHPTNPATWNRYSYVAGDPINHRDPRGLDLLYAIDDWKDGRYDCTSFSTLGPGEKPVWEDFWDDCVDMSAGSGEGGGVTASDSDTSPATPLRPDLVNARSQVVDLIKTHSGCALAIGASSTEDAVSKAQSIGISYGTMSLRGYSTLNYITADAAGQLSPNQLFGQYNNAEITLNAAVNWADPSHQTAIEPDGSAVTVALGVPGVAGAMTAQQFLDFGILHELSHSFGLHHDGTSIGQTQNFYNEAIWNSCIKE